MLYLEAVSNSITKPTKREISYQELMNISEAGEILNPNP